MPWLFDPGFYLVLHEVVALWDLQADFSEAPLRRSGVNGRSAQHPGGTPLLCNQQMRSRAGGSRMYICVSTRFMMRGRAVAAGCALCEPV